ncbi:MAG: restriction endonuclease [Ruminococcaceae bacterium]|nr:restriction endonuclease [Oscillospiraceae bacterium]
MELKQYQKNVIVDLNRFLALLTERQNISTAYSDLWMEKNVPVGLNGMPTYKNRISDVPDVCFKVPTGGGKTFLACCAIKPVFESMPQGHPQAVVWLVPSDSILEQTYKALNNPSHPYRQKIDTDFSGHVGVYSKEQLLFGQNFKPAAVAEQLSIFVLSYDSFRTSKKDGRKAYQENGYLGDFAKQTVSSGVLLPDIDETALIQVVRALNPLVIVDESHHATSDLSIEMLQNFNPCFILDLTATPKKDSNIISFVDAAQLKKEHMVKLPVIVYNRKTQGDVFSDAIHIRDRLENQAKREQAISGRYIRPIVLFQAQSKTNVESTTFDRIKKTLLDCGIPAEQIAVKTADVNELRNVELMSPDCPVRFIITINALKEGWDCPFAYVLATVANRTSTVDVEQILGRILRLPNTEKNQSDVLNISYVLTSSNDFHATLDKVVSGLNNAGFSSKDYYAKDIAPEDPTSTPATQLTFDSSEPEEDALSTVDTEAIRASVEAAALSEGTGTEEVPVESDELLAPALTQNVAYETAFKVAEGTAVNLAPQEVRDKMNVFRMNEEFAEEASALRLPQFMIETGPSLFSETGYELLQQEHLTKGFTLKDKDVQIDFSTMAAEMARVDIDDAKNATPKAWKLTGFDSTYYKEWFTSLPSDKRIAQCKQIIHKQLSKLDCINDKELSVYIDRIIEILNEDQLANLEQSPYPFVIKIKQKVQSLLAAHAEDIFDLWLEQNRITCKPRYALPSTISPVEFTTTVPKSLYTAEENMNEYEFQVVWGLSALDNVKWWHRNISRLGFCVNGPINAYPDIIVMTTSGKILLVETKGDHLYNTESEQKARIGHRWGEESGKQFRYFMVFQTKQPSYPGAYSLDRFMEIVKGL